MQAPGTRGLRRGGGPHRIAHERDGTNRDGRRRGQLAASVGSSDGSGAPTCRTIARADDRIGSLQNRAGPMSGARPTLRSSPRRPIGRNSNCCDRSQFCKYPPVHLASGALRLHARLCAIGRRNNKQCAELLSLVHLVVERSLTPFLCHICYAQAYDSVRHRAFWSATVHRGAPKPLAASYARCI